MAYNICTTPIEYAAFKAIDQFFDEIFFDFIILISRVCKNPRKVITHLSFGGFQI